MQQFTETDLVSNISGRAAVTDPNLVNAWGLSRSSGSPWWTSDNGTGLSTLYTGAGVTQGLVVTVPTGDINKASTGTPTGTIFNGTTDFNLAPGKPALFLFATEDGTISGWNPGVNPTTAMIMVNEKSKSVFKGLTMAQATLHGATHNYLYAADFRRGKVLVYDTNFQHVPQLEAAFAKLPIPHGFAPFNVQNLGGNIYISVAEQDADKHDQVAGPGHGFVGSVRPDGTLLQIMQPGNYLNAPWGMAIASGDFGAFSHDLLVGNFGNGTIVAFDPITGSFKGWVRDAESNPIVIPGLWGLSFGGGTTSGSATALYFGAGINHQSDGLFGMIAPIQNAQGNDQ
jgi:uncharacterized protein (TIGR03118 family)